MAFESGPGLPRASVPCCRFSSLPIRESSEACSLTSLATLPLSALNSLSSASAASCAPANGWTCRPFSHQPRPAKKIAWANAAPASIR